MEIVSLVRRLLFAKQHFLPRAESGSQRVFDPFLLGLLDPFYLRSSCWVKVPDSMFRRIIPQNFGLIHAELYFDQ